MKLSKEQIKILKQSEMDIKKGKLIPAFELAKKDLYWLKKTHLKSKQTA